MINSLGGMYRWKASDWPDGPHQQLRVSIPGRQDRGACLNGA